MIYPVTVMVILAVAVYAIMTFVMPKIKEMFDNLGSELPALTTALVDASDFMVAKTAGVPNSAWVLIITIALVFTFLWWKRTKVGRMIWSKIVLRMPVFGGLMQKAALARFCRSISTLTSSGVGIVKALRITASAVGNPVYEKRIIAIANDVKRGITMGENMKDDVKFFPTMVVGMINVGEQTAQVDQITAKLAEFYEAEVDDTVANLSSLMEPLIIVVLGLTVGTLVIAVMLPILQSSDLAFSGS